MPEGPEVTILSQYLTSKLQNKLLNNINIISGKYKRIGIKGIDKILNKNYKIIESDSKGKLMWIELDNNLDGNIYITSHLGLTGFWSFTENKNDRIRIKITNPKSKKVHMLCYQDPRNFGNIEIITKTELDKKLAKLADDALRTEFTNTIFENKIKNFLSVSSARANRPLHKVLMEQRAKDGLVSGLGNYLMPEILYDCKLSPSRTIGSLTISEINSLAQSIRYVVKLSYYYNTTGYMTNFGNFIETHKKKIDKGIYPNYQSTIVLAKTAKFEFKVYQQKTDSFGNHVEANKEMNAGRTTYWVPNVQK